MVRNARVIEHAAKAHHIRRRRRQALADQRCHRRLRLAALVVVAGEALAQCVLAAAQFFQPLRQLQRIGFDGGQRLQLVLALGQQLAGPFGLAGGVKGQAHGLALGFQVEQLLLGGIVGLEQRMQLGPLGRHAAQVVGAEQALAMQITQALRRALAGLAPLQHRQHLGRQPLALLQPQLIALVAVDAVRQIGQLRLRVRQLKRRLLDFFQQMLLVAARLVVAVQHLLVAEDLEDQAQQLARAQLAEPVGLALLQRQHAADGAGQAGGFEATLPGLDTHPIFLAALG